MGRLDGSDTSYECTSSGGAAQRGAFGPFGLLVLANKGLTEKTPIYFYISKNAKGDFQTFFCADHTMFVKLLQLNTLSYTYIHIIYMYIFFRSSEATDVSKAIYGSSVPVLKGEKLSMRILVTK